MKKTISALALSTLTILALAACEATPTVQSIELANAAYWQRAEASSALWQRGPKAQQLLHKDIAQCTYEVRELERLGTIRAVTPADNLPDGSVPDPTTASGRLAGWDSPEREGYLLTEHSDFHDFETCMMTKGWERVEYLPHDTAEKVREDYIHAITGESRRSQMGERQNDPSYGEPEYDDGLND